MSVSSLLVPFAGPEASLLSRRRKDVGENMPETPTPNVKNSPSQPVPVRRSDASTDDPAGATPAVKEADTDRRPPPPPARKYPKPLR